MKPSAVVLVASLALSPSLAAAGGFGIPEVGARRTGMAAVVGRPDEPSAIFHNPAGLTLLPGMHLYATFGVSLINTEFRLRPWQDSDRFIDDPVDADGYYPQTKPTRAIGAIPMLALTAEILPGKLYGAIGAYVSNGTGAGFDENGVTRYHLIDGYTISPTAVAVLAYQVTPKLALGAGAGIMKVLVHGRRDFFPILEDANGNRRDLSALVGSKPELVLDGDDWAPTWNAGVLVRPIPKLTIGATVIGKVTPEVIGEVTVTYSDDAAVPGDQLKGFAISHLILPWTFLTGANYDATPNLEVGVEGRYYVYRSYKESVTQLNNIPFAEELRTPKNYKDSWQTAGGVRVHDLKQAPGLELMAGFHYDSTPAPKETVTFDQPTFSHYGLHSGVRYQAGRYRLAATYIHYWYDIQTTENSLTSPPTNFTGHGGNNIITVSIEATLGDGALVK